MSLRSDSAVAIAGVGETAVGNLPGTHSTELYIEAARRAIEDSGLAKSEIDGLLTTASVVDDNVRHHMVIAEHLGLFCKTLCDTLRTGGAAFGYAVQLAQWAVQSGRCRAVLVVSADNLLSGPGAGHGVTAYTELGAHSLEFEVPFGGHIPSFYALVAARHMHEYGTTEEQLAAIAVACRKHAALNPAAQKRTPITIDDVINSRRISSPLKLLDCSLISDGGGAVIVTTLERARDLKQRPIRVLGTGQAQSYYHMGHLAGGVGLPRERKGEFNLTSTVQKVAGRDAFGEAGITPADIDVAEIYDSFTITALMQFEDLGFCKKGEGGAFVEGGRIELGGALPTNTHGGLLSYAHPGMPGGIFHLIEGVRQLRHQCGPRQVEGAQTALVTAVSAVASNHSVCILGRD
ncbi:thiolase C-terminal domain-containing protein [Chelatococcus reniformis]|uniref:Thiolase n=1 Tax=Chelatococcus reniformis TaxID=1494448 RepID=A0A916UUU3_9HYPH|nr:thiolase family protein [Chelatococcus reniformis]GGC89490.1 thiolase [Chelatococcus reniformis]